jgi:uncharacterized protein YuzE
MPVAAEYDRDADVLYIGWSDAETARTVEVDEYRVLDFDAAGQTVGLEVLYPAQNLVIAPIAREHGFADLLDAIDEAVADALAPAPAFRAAFSVFYSLPVAPTGPTRTGSSGQSRSEAQRIDLTLLAS